MMRSPRSVAFSAADLHAFTSITRVGVPLSGLSIPLPTSPHLSHPPPPIPSPPPPPLLPISLAITWKGCICVLTP